jgi:hypothetical protein
MEFSNKRMTTFYPPIQVADPKLPSLADYPMDVVLLLIEAIFRSQQMITIDISGPPALKNGEREWDGRIRRLTKVVIQPPPLNAIAGVSRLFRYMYRKSRPTLWGTQLFWSRPYYVDLNHDIFYVRVKHVVHPSEWDRRGSPQLDYLAGALSGIQHMAVGMQNLITPMNMWVMSYLRHLNPLTKKIMIFFPVRDVEKNVRWTGGGPSLSPVLVDIDGRTRVRTGTSRGPPVSRAMWKDLKWKIVRLLQLGRQTCLRTATPEQRQLWERTWRLAPVQTLKGYAVDTERLVRPIPLSHQLECLYG